MRKRTLTLRYPKWLEEELLEVEKRLLPRKERMPPAAWAALQRVVLNGGKRLRPALVLLSARLVDVDGEAPRATAAAVELLHTATLIHDDLIDDAPLRRNVPTLNTLWNPTVAVLVGDLLFARAARLVTASENLQVVRRFTETLEIICSGEIHQSFEERGALPTPQAYEARIYAKTASLFALAAEVGPRLADAAAEEVTAMWRFGKALGLAFQIVDDVLDFTGDEAQLGKPGGNDLRRGIVTLPVLLYLDAHPAARPRLQHVLHDGSRADCDALVADVRRSEALDRALQIAQDHLHDALDILAAYPDSPHRATLEDIAHFAVRRRY